MTIKALLVDVGGVLLTNGWDSKLRKQFCQDYHIDYQEFDLNHQKFFDDFERGYIDFDTYLDKTIFNQSRPFTKESFKRAVFEAAHEHREMVNTIGKWRREGDLIVALLSNEGRELAVDRIERFQLDAIADLFLFSAFVHLRKPDLAIYQLTADILQLKNEEMLYIDDRENLVAAASSLGITSHRHLDALTTQAWLNEQLAADSKVIF